MSRILRRPMFRGGRVDGRGTGITTGLMNGGRVGFQRGGGTSYLTLPEPVTNQSIGRTNSMQAPGITGISLSDFFKPVSVTGQGFSSYRPGDRIRQVEREKFPMYDEFMEETEETQVPDDGITRLTSLTTEDIKIPKQKNKFEGDVELGLPTSTLEEPSTEPKATIPTPKVNEPDTEVTMTDLERALGLDDARKEYVGDALAAASKAFFEGKGFGAISDAATVKSKEPDIKRLAGLEQFKADSRQKMYETKLKQDKVFAPGNTEKLINTFQKVKEGSQAQKIALMDNKLAPTIEGQIKAMTNADKYGSAPSAAEVIGYMQLYHPQTYKGVISADTPPKEDGTYILEDASAILFVKDGKTSVKKLK